MDYIRLKTSLNHDHIVDRLKYNPEIVEFHLNEEDLNTPHLIIEKIRFVKSKGVRVYLHHPMFYQGDFLDIISLNPKMRDHYDWSSRVLADICVREKVKCILHCHYSSSESTDYLEKRKRREMRRRIEAILRISESSFLWEDTVRGIFSAENPYLLQEIVQPLNLPLNIDISHSFIALRGDNRKLQTHLDRFYSYANYFHVVDSMGVTHDSLPLGKGKIDWNMVKPYVREKDFIFEIDLKASNHSDCTPMIESAKYFKGVECYDLLRPF